MEDFVNMMPLVDPNVYERKKYQNIFVVA